MTDIPGTLPTGTVRHAHLRRRVRLESPEGGEIREGEMKFPKKLAEAEPHTNDWHVFKKLFTQKLTDYYRFLEKKGYKLEGRPDISGPWPIPVGKRVRVKSQSVNFNDDGIAEEQVRYIVKSKVRRFIPQFITTDDFWEQVRKAELHGVDLNSKAPLLSQNVIDADTNGKDVIDAPEGGIDPMVEAEESRQARGIKREDYLVGSLDEPL